MSVSWRVLAYSASIGRNEVQSAEIRNVPCGNQCQRPPTAVKKQRYPRWTISERVSKNATCFRLALSSICSHNYARCQRGRTGVRTKALCYMLINKVIKGHLRWRSRSRDQDSASVFRTHKSSMWWCCVVGRNVAGNEGHLFVDVNLFCLAFINLQLLSILVSFDSVEAHPIQDKRPILVLQSHLKLVSSSYSDGTDMGKLQPGSNMRPIKLLKKKKNINSN